MKQGKAKVKRATAKASECELKRKEISRQRNFMTSEKVTGFRLGVDYDILLWGLFRTYTDGFFIA